MRLVAGKQVADIACGTGYGTQMLSEGGARSVRGMDISEDAVAFCKSHNNAVNVTYTVADAEMLTECADAEFDVVISFETIEHLPNAEAYLVEMARILRPGGVFLVSTPDRRISSVMHCFRGRPTNPFHLREYTEAELHNLLSKHFQIKACYGQRFTRDWLVFWPVQVVLKAISRIPGMTKVRQFKDHSFSCGGDVDVLPMPAGKVAKILVFACVRPESRDERRAKTDSVIGSQRLTEV